MCIDHNASLIICRKISILELLVIVSDRRGLRCLFFKFEAQILNRAESGNLTDFSNS